MAEKVKLYWDACIFYEVLGNEPVSPQQRAAIEEILAANDAGDSLIVTSVITHLEVLPKKLAGKGADDEVEYRALFDGVKFAEVEVTANVLIRAREIRDYYYKQADADGKGGKMMDLGDAIHLATASIYGATVLHTRDKDHKRAKVPLIGLYASVGETSLCNKYDLPIVSPESAQGAFPFDASQPKEPV